MNSGALLVIATSIPSTKRLGLAMGEDQCQSISVDEPWSAVDGEGAKGYGNICLKIGYGEPVGLSLPTKW